MFEYFRTDCNDITIKAAVNVAYFEYMKHIKKIKDDVAAKKLLNYTLIMQPRVYTKYKQYSQVEEQEIAF